MKLFRFWVLLLPMVYLFIQPAVAQNNESQDRGESLSITDLTKSIQESKKWTRELEKEIAPNSDMIELFKMLPTWQDSLKRILNSYKEISLQKMSIQKVESMRSEMQNHKLTVDKYKGKVTARLDMFQSNLNDLDDSKIKWLAIEKKYRNDVAINELLRQRLEPLMARLDDRIEQYSNMQRKDLWYLNNLNALDNQIIQEEDLLESRATNIHNLIFAHSQPFWKLSDVSYNSQAGQDSFNQMVVERKRFIANYISFHFDIIIVHIGIFIVLVIVLVLAKPKAVSIFSEKENKLKCLMIFKKPLAAAYIISFLFALSLYPPLPKVIFELVILSLTIPVGYLIIDVVSVYKKKVLMIFLGLFIFHIFLELLPLKTLVGRLISFIYEGIVLGAIIILLKRVNNLLFSVVFSSFVKFFALLFALTTATAMVFEFIGSVQVSHLLINGTILNIGLAIMLYLWSIILKTFILLVFELPVVSGLQSILNNKKVIEKRVFQMIMLYLFWSFLEGCAVQFELKESLSKTWNAFIIRSYQFGELQVSIQDFINFFLVLVITIVLAKFLKYLFGQEILPKFNLGRGMPNAVSTTIYYFITIVGFFLAAASTGIQWSKVNLALGAIGVGVGFGLQSVIYNFISGLILVYERPIQVGDTIEFGNMMGPVTYIGVRSSKVLTYEGAEVIVPNSTLISKEVINWTYSNKRKRRELIIKTTYSAKPSDVISVIKEVLAKVDNVLPDPPPMVLFTGFGDGTHDFRVLFWAQLEVGLSTESNAALAIYDALIEAGYDMPMQKSSVVLEKGKDYV